MQSAVFRSLLFLFPREFRARFADEISDYIALQYNAAQPAGRWATARVSVPICADLLIAAVKFRVSTLSVSRVALRTATTAAGLGAGIICLAIVLVLFEATVRSPLLAATEYGASELDVVIRLCALGAVLVGLSAWYTSLLPRPQKRR